LVCRIATSIARSEKDVRRRVPRSFRRNVQIVREASAANAIGPENPAKKETIPT